MTQAQNQPLNFILFYLFIYFFFFFFFFLFYINFIKVFCDSLFHKPGKPYKEPTNTVKGQRM